jgi:hypothetical protein
LLELVRLTNYNFGLEDVSLCDFQAKDIKVECKKVKPKSREMEYEMTHVKDGGKSSAFKRVQERERERERERENEDAICELSA